MTIFFGVGTAKAKAGTKLEDQERLTGEEGGTVVEGVKRESTRLEEGGGGGGFSRKIIEAAGTIALANLANDLRIALTIELTKEGTKLSVGRIRKSKEETIDSGATRRKGEELTPPEITNLAHIPVTRVKEMNSLQERRESFEGRATRGEEEGSLVGLVVRRRGNNL